MIDWLKDESSAIRKHCLLTCGFSLHTLSLLALLPSNSATSGRRARLLETLQPVAPHRALVKLAFVYACLFVYLETFSRMFGPPRPKRSWFITSLKHTYDPRLEPWRTLVSLTLFASMDLLSVFTRELVISRMIDHSR